MPRQASHSRSSGPFVAYSTVTMSEKTALAGSEGFSALPFRPPALESGAEDVVVETVVHDAVGDPFEVLTEDRFRVLVLRAAIVVPQNARLVARSARASAHRTGDVVVVLQHGGHQGLPGRDRDSTEGPVDSAAVVGAELDTLLANGPGALADDGAL